MSDLPRPRDARRGTSLLATLAAFGIGSLCWISGLVAPLDRSSFDLLTRWLERPVDSGVVIIDLDARSLHALGTWPWRRSRHAQLVSQLQQLGARRVFIDIDFSAPSPHPEDDAQLAQVLARAQGDIVIPAFWQPLATRENALILSEPPADLTRNPNVKLATVNLVPGADGLVRDVADFSTLSSDAIAPVWRRLLSPTAGGNGVPLFLDYRIAPSSFTHFSYADVLAGREKPNLAGKTVFVGATAIELDDIVPVPIHGALPGVVVQAIAYESGLRHALAKAGSATTLLGLLLWAAACSAGLAKLSWKRIPLAAPLLLVVPMGLSFLCYAALGWVFSPAAFEVVTGMCFATALLRYLDLETLRSWRALLRLRHQDALLRQIADVSTDGILTLDSSGAVRDANAAAAAMLAVPLPMLLGRPIDVATHALRPAIDQLGHGQAAVNMIIDLVRPDGSRLPVDAVMTRLSWEDSFVVSIAMRDISAQRRREEELHYHATHDNLTHLGNRRLLLERLESALANATPASRFALLMLDLDGFKQVNEIFGHGTGDDLLIELAKRLKELMQPGTCVARMGGDEFALLLSDQQSTALEDMYRQVRALAAAPVLVQGVPITLSASIGVSVYPEHGSGAALLLQRADIALYSAKRDRVAVAVYNSALDCSSPRRLQMVSELRAALSKEELEVHFQPKVLLSTGQIVEVEALCRWRSSLFGNVSPSEFMPLIEASELIRPFTDWTLRRSLSFCREWRREGPALKVAVNLSARHLQDEDLPQRLGALLHATGAEPGWLELEITESAIMVDTERALGILRAIRQLGVSLSIDDFGTGYSSLSYLQKLPVNRLKIDKSFVVGLERSEHDRLIVKSTIDLAHSLGLEVIAEGIETQSQYGILQGMGCEYGQGFLIARAMPEGLLRCWYAAQGQPGGASAWQAPRRLAAGG